MAWTSTDSLSPLASVGQPEDGDKNLAFPVVPANQAAWWAQFAWVVRLEFIRRCKQYAPYVATVQSVATGLDVNGIGTLKLTITTGSFEQLTGSVGVGTFVIGEVIYAPSGPGHTFAQATKAALVTKVGGTTAAPVLNYQLLPAPSTGLATDFLLNDLVKGNTSAATCTSAAPVNLYGP